MDNVLLCCIILFCRKFVPNGFNIIIELFLVLKAEVWIQNAFLLEKQYNINLQVSQSGIC